MINLKNKKLIKLKRFSGQLGDSSFENGSMLKTSFNQAVSAFKASLKQFSELVHLGQRPVITCTALKLTWDSFSAPVGVYGPCQ